MKIYFMFFVKKNLFIVLNIQLLISEVFGSLFHDFWPPFILIYLFIVYF